MIVEGWGEIGGEGRGVGLPLRLSLHFGDGAYAA